MTKPLIKHQNLSQVHEWLLNSSTDWPLAVWLSWRLFHMGSWHQITHSFLSSDSRSPFGQPFVSSQRLIDIWLVDGIKQQIKSYYRMHQCETWQFIQGDQKVSVHLMITIHKTSSLSHYVAQSDCLEADCQGWSVIRLTLTPSVIPNSNYVIMVSDWNCLKYFCEFF
jgi:hypothetical protein